MNGPGRPRTIRPIPIPPEWAKAYAEARKHPYPDDLSIMHQAFDFVLEELPAKRRQLIRQDMQALSAFTRLGPSQIPRESQNQIIAAHLLSIAMRRVTKDHDSSVLLRQRSIIDQFLRRHPFPSAARNPHIYDIAIRDQQRTWLTEHRGELWVRLDAIPCVCQYRQSLEARDTRNPHEDVH